MRMTVAALSEWTNTEWTEQSKFNTKTSPTHERQSCRDKDGDRDSIRVSILGGCMESAGTSFCPSFTRHLRTMFSPRDSQLWEEARDFATSSGVK